MSAKSSLNEVSISSACNESAYNLTITEATLLNFTTMDSSSADTSGSETNFRVVIITLGVVGMFANGFVALLLKLATGAKKERVNLLMTNQLMLDMFSCFSLIAVYAVKLVDLYLTPPWGFWLCALFVVETPLWIGLNGSTTNLVVIAVERYVMITHPIWHKNNVQAWMIYGAMVFSWIYGIVTNVTVNLLTDDVIDGQCVLAASFPSQAIATAYSIWYFIFSYAIPIVAFCFCYGQILATIVRQSRTLKLTTMASGATSETSAQINAHRTKVNIVKTMTTITVIFVVCWLPISVYYFAIVMDTSLFNNTVYQCNLFFAFFSICLNPFVYAGQYEIIRHRVKKLCGSVHDKATRFFGLAQHLPTVHPSL